MAPKRPDRDRLDDSLDIWAREIPDLDPLTEGIIERIQILARNFNQSMDETMAQYGIDGRSYHTLGRLRKYGPPYQASAGQLATDMRISSGAMTNRLDRMEAKGLIRRLPDPDDRRGTIVEPTDLGHSLWDKTVGTQARREAMLSGVLTEPERQGLHDMLRYLMLAFRDSPDKEHGSDESVTDEHTAVKEL